MSDIAGSSSGGTVDRLLLDAGLDDDAVLRSALQDLRGLAAGQPEPSAAVAALMVPAVQPITDELAARRRAKRRITLTTLSVAVSLAAGGAVAVASDQGLRDSIGQANQAVSSFVATAAGGSTPVPPGKPGPLPARPVSPATVPAAPAAPAVTQQVPAAPGSNSGEGPAKSSGQPSATPAAPLPDLPVPQNLVPGEPGVPGVPERLPNGEGQPPALPLPPAPPVTVPGVHP
jgi:hypothetical protein